MKRVEAIISPLHLEEVKDRLRMIGVPGMTMREVRVLGEPGSPMMYRGEAVFADMANRVQLDVVVVDDMAENVASAIILMVRRSEPSDGVIFISPVDEAIRIRTGEMGADAL